MPSVLHTATVLCPMNAPPLPDGGVLVDGERIVAVGAAGRLRGEAGREVRHDGVLLPGLVDARTLLEQSDLAAAGAPPAPGATAGWDRERWSRSARRGVHALVRAGVTAAGDVVRDGAGVPASCRAGLVGDSWLALADVPYAERDAVLAAVERSLGLPAPGRRVGVAPEPGTLDAGTLQSLGVLAAARDAPVHLAAGGRPMADLDELGLLGPRTSLVTPADLDARDAARLARRGVTAVCCPRPDAAAGREPPLERLAEAGVRLALGSGRPPAAGEAGVLADAAAWVALARRRGLATWPGRSGPLALEEAALRLATVDGARALGWGPVAGTLAAGRRADLTVVEVATTPDRAYADVVAAGAGRVVLTVIAGVRRARRAGAASPWPEVEVEGVAPAARAGGGR